MSAEFVSGFQPGAQAPTIGTHPLARRESTRIAQAILGHVAVYVGPVTAHTALAACCRAIGREPDTIELRDVSHVLATLGPMLSTFMGGSSCRSVLRRIERDLHL
jgi:hypothetical protein